MQKHLISAVVILGLTLGGVAQAKSKSKELDCKMNFTLKTWSFIYKNSKGIGEIVCSDGNNYPVKITAHAGGPTLGKSKLDGTANFTKVENIQEIFGTYVSAQAHGGIVKSGNAQALTKGEVSMTFNGTGRGFDLGLALGGLKIKPNGPAKTAELKTEDVKTEKPVAN